MLYALVRENQTIIAAATKLSEFEEFHAGITLDQIVNTRPDRFEMMMDDDLSSLKLSPIIIQHSTEQALTDFVSKYNLNVVGKNVMAENQERMLALAARDNKTEEEEQEEIKKMLDALEQDDPWDIRDTEQKEQDEKIKKAMKEAREKGALSGDSFSSKQTESNQSDTVIPSETSTNDSQDESDKDTEEDEKLRVWGNSSTVYVDKDNNIIGGNIIATKKTKKREIDEGLVIDQKNARHVYYKIELPNNKIEDVIDLIEDNGISMEIASIISKNYKDGSWIACFREKTRDSIADILTNNGIVVDLYEANSNGHRYIADGVAKDSVFVEDTSDYTEKHPRIWNDMADEIKSMTEDEIKENQKTLTPKEFIYCGIKATSIKGTVIYIAPRSWFTENQTLFDQPLNIDSILPANLSLKEHAPGVYITKNSDWFQVCAAMGAAEFRESMLLQIYVNNLELEEN